MIDVSIRVIGDREVEAKLGQLSPAVHRGNVKATAQLGYRLEGRAKELVSGPMLQVRTGVGRSSINTQVDDRGIGQGASATVGIGRQAPYMAILHEGVDHFWPIYAAKARFLSFMWKGERWFLRRVMHPPLKPRPFLDQPFREEIVPAAAATYQAAIAEELAAEGLT